MAPDKEREGRETVAEALQGIRRDIESPTLLKDFSTFPEAEAGERGAAAPPQAEEAPGAERGAARKGRKGAAEALQGIRRDADAPAAGKGGAASREVFVLTEVVEHAGGLLLDSKGLDDVVAQRTRREVRRWLESKLPAIVREAVAREMRGKGAGGAP